MSPTARSARRTLSPAVFAVFAVLFTLLAGGLAAPALAAPTTTEPLAGLEAAARVVRDVRGIPHLYASNEHDLYFLQGWIHAEDRLFQMDLTRRQASGTLAELLGTAVLGSDVELRTIGLRRAAERSLAVLSPQGLADLEAYAAGVNAWVAAHPLPTEYGLLEVTQFAPWTPADSLVIAKAIAFSLSFDLDVQATVTLATYQQTGAAAGFDGEALFFEDLFRSAPFDPASTVPDAETGAAPATAAASRVRTAGSLRQGSMPSDDALALAAGYLERVRDLPLLRAAVTPRARVEGSNEWGVAGRHTASGRPILANDPHLALDTPATFHQIHLRAPSAGIDVVGSGFAGVPYVVLGQNRYVAWGATTNPMDVTDTYQEQVVPDATSPSGLATMYLGQREAVIPVPETFRYNQLDGTADNLAVAAPNSQVAGTFVPPATLIVPRRNMGPIVALDAAAGTAISVQYTGFSATRELETFRLFNRARGLDDFIRALQFFDFGSQNWAYADVEGNIAYFASGEMPLREDLEAGTVTGLPPFFLRNGTGGNEWLPAAPGRPVEHAVPYQVLPFAEMPQVINPASGWFVNANNDPVGTTLDNNPLDQLRPTGGIYYLNYAYAQGTRAGRITDLLTAEIAAGNVTPADMERIQADVVMLDAQVLVPHIVAAFENLGPGAVSAPVAEAVGRLAAWNGWAPTGIPEGWDAADIDGQRLPPPADEVAASIAATIYSTWRGQMIENTIDATIAPFGLQNPDSRSAIIALRHLLEGFPAQQGVGASGIYFFAAGGGATPAEQRDSLILDSLADALALLASPAFAPAFGGSTDQDDYRWGLLHRVVLDHPLGPPFSIPPAGGAFVPVLPPGLPGIPVDGGFGVVDASSHSARADGVNEFMFGSGPVRRYVGEMGVRPGGTEAVTALPGGESGNLGSPFYFNLLPLWLTNDGYAVIQTNAEVVDSALLRTIYVPAP